MSSACLSLRSFAAAAFLLAASAVASPPPTSQPPTSQPPTSQPPTSQPAAATTRPVLHIVADPNNLPFSNDRREGFENRIAQLIADDLGATIEYTWWAQRRGFFRNAVKHGESDVVMGVPAAMDRVLRTRPYYRSTYVFVYRADATTKPSSFDDPAIRRLKIGIPLVGDSNNTPPAQALADRGIVDNLVGYTVFTDDYRQPDPAARIIRDVADRKIDVAVVWGPLGGYFASRQPVPMQVIPVPETTRSSTPFAFNICVGVKRSRPQLRDQIDQALARHRGEIDRILQEYGVPRTAEQEARNGAPQHD